MAATDFLTEGRIRSARPKPEPYKLRDGGGLYLLITPAGAKQWRLRYVLSGRESMVSLGTYPATSLKAARTKRGNLHSALEAGRDPAAERRAERVSSANTFELIAREWLGKQPFTPKTLKKAVWTFEDLLFPYIGSRPISALTAPELLGVLRRLERRGKHETAHRAKQRVGQVIRYAIATGRAERDPTADLRGALAPVTVTNRAAITEPREVAQLLRALHGYDGHPVVEAALKLAPLVFVRPGELRAAEWSEIDLEAAEWRIAAHRMKMRQQHLVPLARQSVAILRDIHSFTGRGRYVFPSPHTRERPLSDNAITAALRRMGYTGEQMSWHGFRAMASTLLNELGHPPDIIELQLAHQERNEVRAAYNRAQRLEERRKMMQAWADYLDGLRLGTNVVPFRAAK
ncbi:MAG TPA: integrase arm-type DNA-binding domain-containing protein [Steroidobacteraceae bacterium]|nr:integrase arm-type DNA-binding domain-containing protein [Steroidobacteraceae bacterium]